MKKQLYRRETNKYFTGLAGGIADNFNLDASLVRIILIVLEFATAGLLFIVYLIISLFIPKESQIKK